MPGRLEIESAVVVRTSQLCAIVGKAVCFSSLTNTYGLKFIGTFEKPSLPADFPALLTYEYRPSARSQNVIGIVVRRPPHSFSDPLRANIAHRSRQTMLYNSTDLWILRCYFIRLGRQEIHTTSNLQWWNICDENHPKC